MTPFRMLVTMSRKNRSGTSERVIVRRTGRAAIAAETAIVDEATADSDADADAGTAAGGGAGASVVSGPQSTAVARSSARAGGSGSARVGSAVDVDRVLPARFVIVCSPLARAARRRPVVSPGVALCAMLVRPSHARRRRDFPGRCGHTAHGLTLSLRKHRTGPRLREEVTITAEKPRFSVRSTSDAASVDYEIVRE
jgi:hypothetical protein